MFKSIKKAFALVLLIVLLLSLSCRDNQCRINTEETVFLSDQYPNLTCGLLAGARLADLPGKALLCLDNRAYTQEQVEKQICSPLDTPGYEPVALLEQFIGEKLINTTYKSKLHLSGKDGYGDRQKKWFGYLTAQVSITDRETRDYFNRNIVWFPGLAFETVREQIGAFLLSDKQDEAYYSFLNQAGRMHSLYVSWEFIKQLENFYANDPLINTLNNGKISVVIFSYSCCKPDTMQPEIMLLQKRWTDSVNIIHVNSQENTGLADRYRIKINPVTLVFDKSGIMRHRLLYSYTAEEIGEKVLEITEAGENKNGKIDNQEE